MIAEDADNRSVDRFLGTLAAAQTIVDDDAEEGNIFSDPRYSYIADPKQHEKLTEE